MTWWLWFLFGYAILTINFIILWRYWNTADDMQRAEWEVYQAAILLREIAVMSYMCNHHGTWKAWSETMGSIEVQVTTEPYGFDKEEP